MGRIDLIDVDCSANERGHWPVAKECDFCTWRELFEEILYSSYSSSFTDLSIGRKAFRRTF